MGTVSQVLKGKVSEVWTILPTSTTLDALRMMSAKNVGALIVAENGKVLGIFSERDYARQSTINENFNLSMPVEELMTKSVICIGPEDTTETCMEIMTNKRIRHLPVVKDDELVGVVSIGDIVNSIISDQKETIKQLGSFISGERYGASL